MTFMEPPPPPRIAHSVNPNTSFPSSVTSASSPASAINVETAADLVARLFCDTGSFLKALMNCASLQFSEVFGCEPCTTSWSQTSNDPARMGTRLARLWIGSAGLNLKDPPPCLRLTTQLCSPPSSTFSSIGPAKNAKTSSK